MVTLQEVRMEIWLKTSKTFKQMRIQVFRNVMNVANNCCCFEGSLYSHIQGFRDLEALKINIMY